MSASVDQRNKGQMNQVPNGPSSKETVKDSDFEAYLQSQPHQQGAYSSGPMTSPNVSDQTYMPSYYPQNMSFPYLGEGGAWSSGGDPMSFLGNYGQVSNDYMPSNGTMFSGFDYSQAGFGWFPGNEYSAWVNSTQTGKADTRGYEDYYHPDQMHAYGSMNGEADLNIQNIDQGLQSVSLSDNQIQLSPEQSAPIDNAQSVPQAPASVTQAPKKMSWASVASQPARPQPQMKPKSIPRAPVPPSKHNMDIGTWDTKNSAAKQSATQPRQAWSAPRGRGTGITPYSTGPSSNGSGSGNSNSQGNSGVSPVSSANALVNSHPVLDKLRSANQYNPRDFSTNAKGARFFIIKSYSEDDIHRSIKYSIWCSTEHGNKRLDAAFREREGKGPVYLLYSVNGSGHFCGMAQMLSAVDYSTSTGVWAQDKWKGRFEVKWIYVKDVPNSQLRHIRLENNENKPVTNSRDTQEVPPEKGKQVLKIINSYRHTTSIFDDFGHYEKRQEEESSNGAPVKKSGGRGRDYRN